MKIHLGKQDYAIVLRDIGQVMEWASYTFAVPVIYALLAGEGGGNVGAYALSGILTFVLGWVLNRGFDTPHATESKHALLSVSLLWLLYPLLAAIPFVLIQGMTLVDAFFEVISAITTTGLTVMTASLGSAPGSLIFWRSLLSWIGGMGIVVMALLGMLSMYGRSFKLIKVEQQGGKLKSSIRNTVRKIFLAYVVLTLAGIVLLWLAGMNAFSAVHYAMSAISTTGLDITPQGLAGESNIWVNTVLGLLMLLGAMSFALHYRLLRRGEWKGYKEDSEWKVLVALTVLGGLLIIPKLTAFYGDALFAGELAMFSAVSSSTCGGFNLVSSEEVAQWGGFVKLVLIFLMFVGGSAGSTAGGIKVSRAIIFTKSIYWRTKALLLPGKSFFPRTYEGRPLEETEIKEISQFILLYLVFIGVGTLVLTYYGYGLENSLFEVVSAQGNGGISSGIAKESMPLGGKLMLILNMWVGRLEIIPVLALAGYFIAPRTRGKLRKGGQ